MKRFSSAHHIDFFLLITVISLTFFGLLMIYDASSYIAFRDFGNKYHYLRDQSIWILLGFLALGIFSVFDYKKLYKMALPILIIAIVLLFMVFIPGLSSPILGARRWIDFHLFVLQPAEFVKLSLAIYLAAWFSTKEKHRLVAFTLLIGLVLGLVMLEPDMGTASIILAEAVSVFFLSGGSLSAIAAGIPALGLIGFLLIIVEPYRAKRLTTFLNPQEGVQHASYHVQQILIALGAGGLTGVGLGNSLQKYAYLPENTTDSIFAIIAEELGFMGCLILMAAFFVLVWRGLYIAMSAKDMFGRLLAGGITAFLGTQILLNLAAQTALVPLTGVPLPFISYGGSALVVDLCAVGILLNIAKQNSSKI